MSAGIHRSIVAVAVAVTLVMSVLVVPAAAQSPTDPSFVVTVDDGDAEVALTLTFDLTTDSERAAFEELRENETVREQSTERFGGRLESVADEAGDRTGREMSISDVSVDIRTEADGDQGTVTYRATWANLAATDGDELTVTEPFASGFEPDRTLRIVGPDGATIVDAKPSPATQSDGSVVYESGTNLDGFAVTFQQASAEETATADGTGFGITAGLLGILVATLVSRRVYGR